jgi:histidyl-tRNA synthetase
MPKNIISNQEPKGTRDWLPEEFAVRKYIFDTWRRVCERYGFEEYLTPLVEAAEVYRAKSGEDVGGQELVTFTDLGGRELSIRPEMTPSVTRLVSKIYTASPKPLKFFSIANFVRNEKPQRGRNREFWQLNCDIFGSDAPEAELEVLQMSLDIMAEFGAPQGSFVLGLNNRKLLEGLLEQVAVGLDNEKKLMIVRTLDKWAKLKPADIDTRLQTAGLEIGAITTIKDFMASNDLDKLVKANPQLKDNPGLIEIRHAIESLAAIGYDQKTIVFNPAVIRGFDYYDGLIFEVFDTNPDNNRAMFGGGRYNGLAEIFGSQSFPAVGFAPGDETTKLFLESWNLLAPVATGRASRYYLPLLDKKLLTETRRLARTLRQQGWNINLGFEEQKIGKALEFANKKKIDRVIIFGSDEASKNSYKIKDMASGLEQVCRF